MAATHTTNTDPDKNWPQRRCEAMAEDLRPHYGAGHDIGEDYEEASVSMTFMETVRWWWPALRWPLALLSVLLAVHGWFSGWFA